MPEDIVEYVRKKGISQVGWVKVSRCCSYCVCVCDVQEAFSSMEDPLPQTDVLYMTRIQRERFPSQESYDKVVCQAIIV